jgi:hypothetical protein
MEQRPQKTQRVCARIRDWTATNKFLSKKYPDKRGGKSVH